VRETPLLSTLRELGANIGEFAGWLTAMDYGNPLDEHMAARTSVAVFDVSHMGRYVIRGENLFEFFQRLLAKDLKKFREGRMSGPALMLNERGGIKDDVMLYYISDDEWMAVVNAPNIESDREWMLRWAREWGYRISVEDVTLKTALIAVQGPEAPKVLRGLGIEGFEDLKILEFIRTPKVLDGKAILVSRSGWTGEEVRTHGFEIMADASLASKIFRKCVELGAKPAGLIARDSLRLEMGYVLIGEDISEDTNPIEARYWMGLSLKKDDFIGRDAVLRAYREGVRRFRYGLRLKKGERRIPRHGTKVLVDGVEVGEVTSGAYSPYLRRSIGMAYIKPEYAYVGFKASVEIRGRVLEAKILDFPLI